MCDEDIDKGCKSYKLCDWKKKWVKNWDQHVLKLGSII